MAKEIEVVNVSPAEEARTIRSFESFGWVLRSNQAVYAKDSHLERRGRNLYSVTETTNYVKLTFERDGAKLKYYDQLCRLEDEFYAIPLPKKPHKYNKSGIYIAYILYGLIVLLGLLLRTFAPVCAGVAGIALFELLYRRMEKKQKEWKTAYDDCWSKREQVLRKVAPYL